MAEVFATTGAWILFGIWALLLVGSLILTILGLGGNFFILFFGFIYAAITGFEPVGWGTLLILLGLAVLGEVVESLLGLVYVAAKGATRYGVGGAFVGGLIGAIVGSGALPVIGTILGSFIGAFIGALSGEYYRERRLEPSLRIGWHAFAGKMLATLIKFALGVEMVWLLLRAARP